jgi:dihydroorotate dehydrogenase
LGVNIGKNKDTPLENAIDDYLFGFRHLWKYASYFTINISSPNTPCLRDLQRGELLAPLLQTLKKEQKSISTHKYVPIVVKISPDLSDSELAELAGIFLHQEIDGVIATNTTITRNGVESSKYATEAGGLSGKPLKSLSTEIIKKLYSLLGDKIPIIASGGVMDKSSAQEKFNAGAKLVQIYSGFIFHGPELVSRLAKVEG